MEPLARDGLPPFLLFLVASEGGAFLLQGAHGCFIRSPAVWVAAVVLYAESCQAALPAPAWYALVIVSDWWHICLRGVVFRDGLPHVVPLDSASSVFVPVQR